jgi:hypothetical protein
VFKYFFVFRYQRGVIRAGVTDDQTIKWITNPLLFRGAFRDSGKG